MVERNLTDEEIEKVNNFGALGYTPRIMASILGWEESDVEKQMKTANSQFARTYQKGADIAAYLIDKKLFDMAMAGDIKAMEKYEYRKKQKK